MKLELKKFVMSDLKDDSVVLFIGKRNTGKSVLVRDVMFHNQKLPVGVVISPTEKANQFFENFVPNMLIYDEFSPDIVKKFIDRQEKITKQYNAEKKKYGKTSVDPKAFFILDDCLYDKTWPTDKNIRCLFMNGRHYKVLFLITMQYPLGIPPHLRTNVDYVFILRENQVKNRERIYQQYAGMFPSYEIFSQVLDQCTENYEGLVIDNKVQSNKLEDQVYWYKADLHNDFRVGDPKLWNIQALQMERQLLGIAPSPEEDEEEDFDPKITKKKAPMIRVRKQT
jgi:hypothetical protein